VRVRAPGKVVLLGEYAVLDGAPAIVAAVDRGVACDVERADALAIEVPRGDDRFVRAALLAAGAGPARYRFADWNPVDAPVKVGLGGSAAATVAAVLAADPGRPRDDRFRLAREVHRQVQGSGSGIDVAASTYGGVSRFVDGVVTPLPPVSPTVVFSGTAAATGPRVERYLAWPGRAGFAARSAAAVDRFAADPVGALAEAGDLLRAMGEAAGLDYWTDPIDVLVAAAGRHGGAAKPSGAGGGDVVVALFADPEARASYERWAAEAGFLVVPVALAGPAS
jgi:phosphomevalonate kinase